jgi:hypothetical protein
MKFQVYFDPDFDYFLRRAAWTTLATMAAVGNTAQAKIQQRAGASKYRVQSPKGGEYAAWTSKASVIRVKGKRTTGILTVAPASVFEEDSVQLSVKLADKKTSRSIYLLTSDTCDGAPPWIEGRGPSSGWKVVGEFSNGLSQETSLQNSGRSFVQLERTASGAWNYGETNLDLGLAEPIKGQTVAGEWSRSLQIAAADNGRCFAAIAPAQGLHYAWISNVVKVSVAPRYPTQIKIDQLSLESDSLVDAMISGTVTAEEPRIVTADICNTKSPAPVTTTTDSTGQFSLLFSRILKPDTYKVCLSTAKATRFSAANAEVALNVSRTVLSGSVSVSATVINIGEQFTVSGSVSPYVSGREIWIRVYCKDDSGYFPLGWSSQSLAYPAHSGTGNRTGTPGLHNFDSWPVDNSSTKLVVDSSGNFSKTFTSNTSQICVYGAYVPATDYYSAWLSDPTGAVTVR